MLVRQRRGFGDDSGTGVLSYDPLAGQDPNLVQVEISIRSVFDQYQAAAQGNLDWLSRVGRDRVRQLIDSGTFARFGVTSFDDPRVQALLDRYFGANIEAARVAYAAGAKAQEEYQAAERAAGWSPVAPPSSQPSRTTTAPAGASLAQLNPDVSMLPIPPGPAGPGFDVGNVPLLPSSGAMGGTLALVGIAVLGLMLLKRKR